MSVLPNGFKFSGISCGIKESGGLDLALISTSAPSVVAGVYTQNVVRASSIDWNRNLTPADDFRAVVINSGNANACTGEQGIQDNQRMAQIVAEQIGATAQQVLVLSTGVIGQLMPMANIEPGIIDLISQSQNSITHFNLASQAIMTTDQGPKTISLEIQSDGQPLRVAGIAKGAGMIGPNMATMLAIMVTDAKLSPANAQAMLATAANRSFNRISVEGHTSTNDALLLIATGESGVEILSDSQLAQFSATLDSACIELAKQIPSDGEGASHLVTIEITGAQSEEDADQVARTIAASALVKTAIAGSDPNWGRIVSAAGYSSVAMDIAHTHLTINGNCVFQSGQPIAFDEAAISQSMADNFETKIKLNIGLGKSVATHWTSDLTVEYVKFNSEYTT